MDPHRWARSQSPLLWKLFRHQVAAAYIPPQPAFHPGAKGSLSHSMNTICDHLDSLLTIITEKSQVPVLFISDIDVDGSAEVHA
eukprot:3994184-Amphidinium_carterae.2